MRTELEKRIRKQRAELDGIEKDIADLQARKSICLAIINEFDALLRLAPKTDNGGETIERQLRVDTDPYHARELLRKERRSMHIKELLEKIGGDTGRNRRSSLASQLGAYARKGEIFTKDGPNVFGLIDYGPQAITLDEEKAYMAAADEPDEPPPSTGRTWGDVEEEFPF